MCFCLFSTARLFICSLAFPSIPFTQHLLIHRFHSAFVSLNLSSFLTSISCSLAVSLGDCFLIQPGAFSCFLYLPLSFPQTPIPHPLSFRDSLPPLPHTQLHPHRHANIQPGKIKSENISFNLQFIPCSNISSPHPLSAWSGRCFIFTLLYTISPRERPTNNHLFCCWLTGAVEGLSALLKDTSNESEE